MTALLEIVQRAAKAIQGSDYNWDGWFREKLGEVEVEQVDISKEAASHTKFRKTHINVCIEELEKRSQLSANQVYNLLSEMVHPNFGSNTLVIVTRNRTSDLAGEAVLSSNPKNVEAAAWFFELASEPLSKIFELERDYVSRSNALLRLLPGCSHEVTTFEIMICLEPSRRQRDRHALRPSRSNPTS